MKLEQRRMAIEKFKDEETDPLFEYPPGFGILPLPRQMERCSILFPELNFRPAWPLISQARLKSVHEMEGYVLSPKLAALARLGVHHGANPTWPMYNQAFFYLVYVMNKAFPRFFVGYAKISPDYVRLNERTAKAYELYDEAVPAGDYNVMPVQLGKRFAGMSPRRAQVLFDHDEFALDPCTLGAILLVHQEVIPRWGSFRSDCPGAMYSYKHNGEFLDCSRVDVEDSKVIMGEWNFQERFRPHQGTASAQAPAPF